MEQAVPRRRTRAERTFRRLGGRLTGTSQRNPEQRVATPKAGRYIPGNGHARPVGPNGPTDRLPALPRRGGDGRLGRSRGDGRDRSVPAHRAGSAGGRRVDHLSDMDEVTGIRGDIAGPGPTAGPGQRPRDRARRIGHRGTAIRRRPARADRNRRRSTVDTVPGRRARTAASGTTGSGNPAGQPDTADVLRT